MEESLKTPSRCHSFPLYYLFLLLIVTYLMIDFMKYDSNDHIPSMDRFTEVAEDEEFVAKPLPNYNFDSLPHCRLSQRTERPRLIGLNLQRSLFRCTNAMLSRFYVYTDGIIRNWQTVASACDEEKFVRDLPVRDIGADSWAILPTCKEKNTLVVMGMRNNTKDVDYLLEKIPNLETFGTDPFLTESHNIKKFFNFGLTENQENSTMEVELDGVNKTVASKGIKEFMKNDLKLKKIDMLYINPTYGDFPFWKYIHKDGEFKKLGVVVCQMMIEVPKDKGKRWAELIEPLVQHSNFIVMRPRNMPNGAARGFFVNVQDPVCARKYIE